MPKKLKLNGSVKICKTFRTNTKKKKCPFYQQGLECKIRKPKDTWSKGKLGLGVQNEAGQRLTELNTLVIANTLFQQNKR